MSHKCGCILMIDDDLNYYRQCLICKEKCHCEKLRGVEK